MLRFASLSFAAALLTASAVLPALADSYTTRIEPRPFYGATVTLEEGVRVFRPLPPTRQVIINPESRTPLNLSFEDVRVIEQRTINTYNHGDSAGSAPAYGGGGYYVPRHRGNHTGSRRPAGMPAGGVR